MRNVRRPSAANLSDRVHSRACLETPALAGAIRRRAHRAVLLVACAAVLGGILHPAPAQAVEFGVGENQGRLDTTISHGVTVRVEDRDSELAADANGNDGNLNYDRGVVSNASKFTSDLEVGTRDFGAFVRVTGFVDHENQNGTRERTPLSDEAKERVGRDLELLDAYLTGAFDVGESVVDLRLGKQVLNWGESTFIPNGVNAINHFDVSKLRRPGSELREALLPVGLASVAVAPTDALSVEGFYQFDWEETEIDPVGGYFSSTDYVGPGARKAVLSDLMERLLPDEPLKWDEGFGFGPLTQAINADLAGYTVLHPQLGMVPAPQPAQAAFDANFATVRRGADRVPDDSGQWGVALRYLAEELNDTEFGFYFINYHSRLPTVSATAGGRDGVLAGLAAAGAVGASDSVTVGAVTRATTQAVQQQVTAGVQAGLIDPAQAPGIIRAEVGEHVSEQVQGIASALAIDRYAKSGEYFIEYPEDIQLFGLSFNTVLGVSGWALQGEYSLRRDAPLQRAERKVLEDGLRPIITGLTLAGTASAAAAAAIANPTAETLGALQQAGADFEAFQDGYSPSVVKGYVERDVSQVQATATRVFGPTMGADGLVFVTEVALMQVHDMPDTTTAPLESPAGGVLATPEEADADETSWGYRLAARLDYNNAIGSINLYPYTQFLHDVSGNSPAPSGPFVEGRTALTLGLRADYLSRWQADVGYTRYAGEGNELSDRDFVSASIKYSF